MVTRKGTSIAGGTFFLAFLGARVLPDMLVLMQLRNMLIPAQLRSTHAAIVLTRFVPLTMFGGIE